MRKIFTLAVAAMAALSVSAQTTYNATETAPAAGDVLIDDDLATISTVYETKAAANSQTINGKSFDAYFQLRVEADPDATTPTGTQRSECTPLVVVAKDNANVTIYYRRQLGTDGYDADDNKDVLVVDQAALADGSSASSVKMTTNFTLDEASDATGSYGFGSKTFAIESGHTYTIYRRGSTVRVYGIVTEAASEDGDDTATAISTVAVEQAGSSASYNVAGQRVNDSAKGIVIKNGKKYVK